MFDECEMNGVVSNERRMFYRLSFPMSFSRHRIHAGLNLLPKVNIVESFSPCFSYDFDAIKVVLSVLRVSRLADKSLV